MAPYKGMEKELRNFNQELKNCEVGVFYFAGHGMQIEGFNYLLAIDTDTEDELEAKHSSLQLNKIIEILEKSNTSTNIIILDACRDNPWERAWNRSRASSGLAPVYAPKGTLIAFATSPGEVAADGMNRNGTYTEALLQHIDSPNCHIEQMFKMVRNSVAAATKSKQTSWEHTSLSGNFFFNPSNQNITEEYSEIALADSLLIIDETKISHKIIKALKTHNWYIQNPAVIALSGDFLSKINNNNLFIIGRNLYQSACGSANEAINFMQNFPENTSKLPKAKRKALLDGILYEMFFDKNGIFRKRIKLAYFNEIFELQKYKEFSNSFDFIKNALLNIGDLFYSVPGTGHTLNIAISYKKIKTDAIVKAIYIDGKNILRPTKDAQYTEVEPIYRNYRLDEFKEYLSKQLVVPERLLNITYSPALNAVNKIHFNDDFTVRKTDNFTS